MGGDPNKQKTQQNPNQKTPNPAPEPKQHHHHPQKKSFGQVFYFMQGCQLDKLQACVPRLLKDDKALPVVWLNFWINCYVTGLQQKEMTENSLSQSVFLAEVECLLISTGMSGAGGCIAGYQHGHEGLKKMRKEHG